MKKQLSFEEALEDNLLRPFVRDRMEIIPLAKAVGKHRFEKALQVACARGDSTIQLLHRFDIHSLTAVDKNRDSVSLAIARQAVNRSAKAVPAPVGSVVEESASMSTVNFLVRDIPELGFPDDSFEGVFNLAELHNYAEWRIGLSEMARVLAPGGLLIMNELTIESFSRGAGPYFRKRTVHPYDRMFKVEELREAIQDNHLKLLHFESKNPLGLLPYLIIVAQKTG